MDKHLVSALARIIERRKELGATTNVEALALALEHGRGGRTHLFENPRFFCDPPIRSGGEDPSCWINPNGMVYGVAYSCHCDMTAALGLNYADMERQGWLHVSGGRIDQYFAMSPGQKAAVDQLLARNEGYYFADRMGTYPLPRLELMREGLWHWFNARPTRRERMDPDLAALCDLASPASSEPMGVIPMPARQRIQLVEA